MSDRERARELMGRARAACNELTSAQCWSRCEDECHEEISAIATALAQARAEGLRQAATELEVNWGHIATPEMRDAIRALAEGGE